MPRPAPPAAAILYRSRSGSQGTAAILERSTRRRQRRRLHSPSPRTQQLPPQLPPQDPVVGDREGRGRGTENKKGEGKGEEGVGNGSKLSAQRSRCCSHHPILAATSIELQLAASAKACQKPNLSLWGSRTHQSRPEWLLRHPISSLASLRHQSAQGGGEEPQGQARLRRSPAAVRKAVFAKALRPSPWRKGN